VLGNKADLSLLLLLLVLRCHMIDRWDDGAQMRREDEAQRLEACWNCGMDQWTTCNEKVRV